MPALERGTNYKDSRGKMAEMGRIGEKAKKCDRGIYR